MATPSLSLQSLAFNNNDWIPSRFTCKGNGVIPPLRWLDAPPQTRSLVLVMRQREAPEGQQVRWLVYDLPVDPNLIPEGGILPEGAKTGRNDLGQIAYEPPCDLPDHQLVHYDFYLYATDVRTLDLGEGASWAEVKEKLRAPRSRGGEESYKYDEHVDVVAPPYHDKMAREWHELGHVICYAEMGGHFAKNIDTHIPGVDLS